MEAPQLHASPLEENAASAGKALRQMRALLAERPDVELSCLEDWYLLRFLRCKLYDPIQALRLNCFPIRINGVHVVNEPAIFGLVFSLFKSFLNERMQKRLFLHGHDMESLHSHITPDWLPPDLGGSGKETDLNEWLSYVLSQPVVLGLKKVGYIFEDDLII
ncbi:clavesin-1-like [Schistocerca nitens]|uniref:clavesin-1-like n=1 Tax=Schistocerca nitens TaxID=7011 RepID=UPI0021178975|nr:clavesin-1-like [Schistocerca nitens]